MLSRIEIPPHPAWARPMMLCISILAGLNFFCNLVGYRTDCARFRPHHTNGNFNELHFGLASTLKLNMLCVFTENVYTDLNMLLKINTSENPYTTIQPPNARKWQKAVQNSIKIQLWEKSVHSNL